MRVLNSGMGSLYARIDMIRRARRSIDMEYYIFDPDVSGRLILQELREAARRGVKVRIMVDKFPGEFALNEHYAQELRAAGIEIRYYNPQPLYRLNDSQYRNHRKLMVMDGEEALTGGRNIADEYFDLHRQYNYLDRDVTVRGDVVRHMQQTFDNYWASPIVETPRPPERPVATNTENGESLEQFQFDQQREQARRVFAPDPEVDRVRRVVEVDGLRSFNDRPERTCPEVSFASDREGATSREARNSEDYQRRYRLLRQEIARWMEDKIRDEVTIESPYFLRSKITDRLFELIQQRNARVRLFTNSLVSSDAVPISTAFTTTVRQFTPLENFRAYVYRGRYSGEGHVADERIRNGTWGIHSKSIVFNNDSFMIGSYNIDNRSSFYNTELAVFCSGSPELARDVRDNIQIRMNNSYRLNAEGNAEDCEDIQADAGLYKQIMYQLLRIPAHLMEHLL